MGHKMIAQWTQEVWNVWMSENHEEGEELKAEANLFEEWDKLIPRAATLTQIRNLARDTLVDDDITVE